MDRRGDRLRFLGIKIKTGFANHFRYRARIRYRDRATGRHRLQGRKAKPFIQSRVDQNGSPVVENVQYPVLDEPGNSDGLLEPEFPDCPQNPSECHPFGPASARMCGTR